MPERKPTSMVVGDQRRQHKAISSVTSGEATEPDIQIRNWPELQREALAGIAGAVVSLATRNSEADPAAVLATFLCRAGVEYGTRPHIMIGDTRHEARLNAVIVGNSSKSRKGTSAKPVERVFCFNDKLMGEGTKYTPARTTPGPLSSGEGLIYAVRDSVEEWKVDKKTGTARWTETDPGVTDKRLFVLDEEFAAALKSTKREGNTLSCIIRSAFDHGTLEPLTKGNRIKSTGAHLAIVTHITTTELHRLLDETEVLNGFANRFLWVCSRRQRLVPLPKPMPADDLFKLQRELLGIFKATRSFECIHLSDQAEELWVSKYPQIAIEKPGLVGCVTNRAEAIAMRLSLIYCLLDASNNIRPEHMESALAFWDYANHSAKYIFAGREANRTAQTILDALSRSSLTLSDIHVLFKNHSSRRQIEDALNELWSSEKIDVHDEKTPGRNRRIISLRETSEESEIRPDCCVAANSLLSLNSQTHEHTHQQSDLYREVTL